MMISKYPTSLGWQQLFRSTRFSMWLLGIIIVSLAARTAVYNYDIALSAKDNAYNFNPLYKPVKSLPVKAQKPRALANITLPMAQTHSDIRQNSPLVDVIVQHHSCVSPLADSTPKETSLRLAYFNSEPPDLCVRHSVFRI